jgi:alpha-tubulin suppressor-like RCC1 family protein
VTAISAGGDFALALVSSTGVLAWGDNGDGQLGNGTMIGASSTSAPVDLPAGTSVTKVSAGNDFSLALTSTGSVLAWGDNGDGQLGDAGTANSLVPAPVDLPAGTSVIAVAADGENSLAVAVHTSC